jgi:uncharacterized protein (DUF58 family)
MISDPVFLRRLEQLRKVARRVGRGGRGEHQSRHRGAGLELADHRAYAAGDDPRRLDWNAFARLERPLVRLFHADESLRTYILVDISGSMQLGTPSKLEQALRVAAALAYLGVAALDPVTILTFGTQLRDTLEASGGKRQIPALFEQLGHLEAAGETDLDAAVTTFLSRQRPRGLVVVLSDFLGEAAVAAVARPLLRLRHGGHLTTVVQITAADDRHGPGHPTDAGQTGAEDEEIVAEDVETGASRVVSLSPGLRARYQGLVLARLEALGRFCRGRGITYLAATAEQPFDAIVLRLLRVGGLGA